MMKNRFMIAVWWLAALIWTVFGLLFLLRLHYWFRGAALLALAALSLFVALRSQKRAAAEEPSTVAPGSGMQKPPDA